MPPDPRSPSTRFADSMPAIMNVIRSSAPRCLQALGVGVLLAAGVSAACAGDDLAKLNEEGRRTADSLVQMIRGELVKAIESSGPLRAIVVCKYSVPEITSNISRTSGWKVSRVALRPRNPALGTADAWEQRAIMGFEQAAARGDKEPFETSEIVAEPTGRYYRYARALTLGPLCMTCHGPADHLTDAVKAQLAVEYPNDRATGYKPGQVRGAVTIKRPLP